MGATEPSAVSRLVGYPVVEWQRVFLDGGWRALWEREDP